MGGAEYQEHGLQLDFFFVFVGITDRLRIHFDLKIFYFNLKTLSLKNT